MLLLLLLGKATWIQYEINWMVGLELSPWLHYGIPESYQLIVDTEHEGTQPNVCVSGML
uniref:Uncharacterized protein n=1 Tax=Setaria viridis TaxID=4556 RepID=A0A4U6TA09_SETVI|nr:hypothetical protein SEVIR_9G510251v2 [Setaria viridis]